MVSNPQASRFLFIVLSVLFLSLIASPSVRAQAPYQNTQSWTGPGPNGTPITITFTTPDGPPQTPLEYHSCTSASDRLFTTGVPSTWTLRGYVNVYYTSPTGPAQLAPKGNNVVNQTGDLDLTIYYTPPNAWPPFPVVDTRTNVIDLAIAVLNEQGLPVTWVGVNFNGVMGPGQNWTVLCTNPPVPALNTTKYTNGADANNPDGTGVPRVAAGNPITWTYRITNTGTAPIARTYLYVTDNQPGVTPGFDQEISGNGDQILDPGEVWQYAASGTALDLTSPPAGVTTVATSCSANKTLPHATAYVNTGTVAPEGGPSFSDVSSYCNPSLPIPDVSVIKYVSIDNQASWDNADAAPGPTVLANKNIFFKFVVNNVGAFPLSNIALADTLYSTNSCTIPTSLAVGGSFNCVIGPFLAQQGQHTNTVTVTAVGNGMTVNDHDSANYYGKFTMFLPRINKSY